jgi:phosphoketolase
MTLPSPCVLTISGGTTPGQNFIDVHLNQLIRQYDLDMIDICGPDHGGPTVVVHTYLEGTYSEVSRLAEHATCIRADGGDMPEIRDWRWAAEQASP